MFYASNSELAHPSHFVKRKYCSLKCARITNNLIRFGDPKTRTHKICWMCKKKLLLEEFCKQKKAADGHQFICKKCHDDIRLKRIGWSNESKETAYIQQNARCEICLVSLISVNRAHADHNHLTGKKRGLLCPRCNHVLQVFEQDDLVENIMNYLKKYK